MVVSAERMVWVCKRRDERDGGDQMGTTMDQKMDGGEWEAVGRMTTHERRFPGRMKVATELRSNEGHPSRMSTLHE
ncbi:hypothetical protein E3N88_36288 [Mikania micrantha]|uniref:Uncharacterized protein n=1 Tax=Mikania micrantha TaxID=192012 RepID=A0A5N6M3P4_9ASTR|nr:hypothetical protein E3N88_36288 [Mikania micrantha]